MLFPNTFHSTFVCTSQYCLARLSAQPTTLECTRVTHLGRTTSRSAMISAAPSGTRGRNVSGVSHLPCMGLCRVCRIGSSIPDTTVIGTSTLRSFPHPSKGTWSSRRYCTRVSMSRWRHYDRRPCGLQTTYLACHPQMVSVFGFERRRHVEVEMRPELCVLDP